MVWFGLMGTPDALAGPALNLQGALPQQVVQQRASGRVSLDVRNADLRAVVTSLAAVGRVNAVMPDHVQGRVSATLRNVPWQVALKQILKAQGFGAAKDGNVLYIDRATVIEHDRYKAFMRSYCSPETVLPHNTFCRRP